MKQYKNLLTRNNIEASKYTIKGKSIIIDTSNEKYVIKKNSNIELYKYLNSRNFPYFPKILDYDNNTIMCEYIDDINYDDNEKAFDLIHYIALLHSKTSYYKEIDFDEYKNIYESLNNQIDYIYNYYLDIITIIESKIYMSPSEYLIARNISKIFECINYCKNATEDWYEIVKDKKRKRVVTLHNNVDTSNLLKNNEAYLISWQNSKIDMPIYDFVNFYKKRALDFDFVILLEEYERIYPLLEEEKRLLLILISIPEKIVMESNEYNMVRKTRKVLDKIYKTEFMLTFKEEEKQTYDD